MRILVTGGAGYIGSHAALRLVADGHDVTIVDNLTRGHRAAVAIVEREAGRVGESVGAGGSGGSGGAGGAGEAGSGGIGRAGRPDRVVFHAGEVGDRTAMTTLMRARRIEAVLHFAALAYVGESVDQPLRYWHANLSGTVGLLGAMEDAGVSRIVFSSTCATYGEPPPAAIPIAESTPQVPVNPYGRSKLACEQVLEDVRVAAARQGREFGFTRLRYFNVAGCDRGGRLGEDHRPETHLIPIALEVALGRRPSLSIFGDDYATPDGTCVRDYVHVDDLVAAHVLALEATVPGAAHAWNVGIGVGRSVRDVVESARRVTGHPIPVTVAPPRAGDPATLYADGARIARDLGWRAEVPELDAIVESAWRWRRANPDGYPA